MTDDRVSMQPQCYCALPWCGTAPGGPNKVRIIGGQRLEYPASIDAHHVDGGHTGPVVYWCHTCHMQHHHKSAIAVEWTDGTWQARRPWTGEPLREMVVAAEWDH